MRIARRYVPLLLLGLLVGCSGSRVDKPDNTLRENLGTTTRLDVLREAEDVLVNRYNFQLQRRVDTAEEVYMETDWQDDVALQDEVAAGVAFTRSRISVRARPRNRSGGAETYTATFTAEVEGRLAASDEWVPVPLTEEREAMLKEIATTIKNELRSGFRTY